MLMGGDMLSRGGDGIRARRKIFLRVWRRKRRVGLAWRLSFGSGARSSQRIMLELEVEQEMRSLKAYYMTLRFGACLEHVLYHILHTHSPLCIS